MHIVIERGGAGYLAASECLTTEASRCLRTPGPPRFRRPMLHFRK